MTRPTEKEIRQAVREVYYMEKRKPNLKGLRRFSFAGALREFNAVKLLVRSPKHVELTGANKTIILKSLPSPAVAYSLVAALFDE